VIIPYVEREIVLGEHRKLSISIDEAAVSDVYQIGIGAFEPLIGFMTEREFLSVVAEMRLQTGGVWPIPVVLPIDSILAADISIGEEVLLLRPDGVVCASMQVVDKFLPNLKWYAECVYGTSDRNHPGIQGVFERGTVFLGGPIRVIEDERINEFSKYSYTPEQCKKEFASRGWKSIVGFQTRNPIHRAHEYIQKVALETIDGLFLHPLVGPTKSDDVPASIRLQAYEAILQNYYPANSVFFGVYEATMRYAGPREAVMHALVRRNYGCTHFIIGRDHAGVGNYYGTYDAQKIFGTFSHEELGIIPMFFENAFYCKECLSMATKKTCPHSEDRHVTLSGTKVRSMLKDGISLPSEFSRPEVVKILEKYYATL